MVPRESDRHVGGQVVGEEDDCLVALDLDAVQAEGVEVAGGRFDGGAPVLGEFLIEQGGCEMDVTRTSASPTQSRDSVIPSTMVNSWGTAPVSPAPSPSAKIDDCAGSFKRQKCYYK